MVRFLICATAMMAAVGCGGGVNDVGTSQQPLEPGHYINASSELEVSTTSVVLQAKGQVIAQGVVLDGLLWTSECGAYKLLHDSRRVELQWLPTLSGEELSAERAIFCVDASRTYVLKQAKVEQGLAYGMGDVDN